MAVTDTQLLRGAANCLFNDLRRDRWQTFTSSSVNDPTGNPTAHRLTPTGFPNPASNPRVETIDSMSGIRGYVFSGDDYPGDVTYAVRLDKVQYFTWHFSQTDGAKYLLASTLATAPCRAPFRWGENRHAKRILRRSDGITQEAAVLLETIASLAKYEALSAEVEDALIADHEVDPGLIDGLEDALL